MRIRILIIIFIGFVYINRVTDVLFHFNENRFGHLRDIWAFQKFYVFVSTYLRWGESRVSPSSIWRPQKNHYSIALIYGFRTEKEELSEDPNGCRKNRPLLTLSELSVPNKYLLTESSTLDIFWPEKIKDILLHKRLLDIHKLNIPPSTVWRREK